MSSSPFPYTCELCGAEGLTDQGMRDHTLQAHLNGRPECPFCDIEVPQPQLANHVQRAHLHYLTPEKELMAFIDDHSPGYTSTDSFYTPGSLNGWHSPDISSSENHNGAISKNSKNKHSFKNDNDNHKDDLTRSQKNVNLNVGLNNINLSNGYGVKSKEKCVEKTSRINGVKDRDKHSNDLSKKNDESPQKSKLGLAAAGEGSPLRSQLALKLNTNTPKKEVPSASPSVQCFLCEYKTTCPKNLEEHINRAHFDLTSPSLMGNANHTTGTNPTLMLTGAMAFSPAAGSSTFQCPLCEMEFASGSDVEVHVNVDHRDILSPQKCEQLDNASSSCEDVVMLEDSPVSNCPVCCQPLPTSQHELIQHIEEHFELGEEGAIRDAQREAERNREQYEFNMLRAQYGMEEDTDCYAHRANNSLKRAVYSGALSVASYYERSIGLKKATASGSDEGSSRTTGILDRIHQLNSMNTNIVQTYMCSAVDHYASTYGDKGWGCGYRNMQMIISSLMCNPSYMSCLSVIYDRSNEGSPSIPSLQLLVERAWGLGFDTQGSEQLGSKLHNTRKWIGACEVVTVLASLKIRCQLIDFHKPTGADGSHPALFEWVLRYFETDPDAFKPPLYLQHQGHSRTIIGLEKHRDGKQTLLVLDPSHSSAQVRQALSSNVKLLRRDSTALRAKQYQLAAVGGVVSDDEEYEGSKVLQSVRIP